MRIETHFSHRSVLVTELPRQERFTFQARHANSLDLTRPSATHRYYEKLALPTTLPRLATKPQLARRLRRLVLISTVPQKVGLARRYLTRHVLTFHRHNVFNMRISPTVYIVCGYYLLVCAYLHKELGYIWRSGQRGAFLLEFCTKLAYICLLGIQSAVTYRCVCRYFRVVPYANLIDEPHICGTELCFTRGERDYRFFLTFPQASWMAKVFWLKRRCTIDNMRMVGSAMRLTGLRVAAHVVRYDHMER